MTTLTLVNTDPVRTEWRCAGCRIAYVGPKPDGWIDETQATIGGGTTRYVACFPCRNLVAPEPHYGITRELL